jgi:hypothetical protein
MTPLAAARERLRAAALSAFCCCVVFFVVRGGAGRATGGECERTLPTQRRPNQNSRRSLIMVTITHTHTHEDSYLGLARLQPLLDFDVDARAHARAVAARLRERACSGREAEKGIFNVALVSTRTNSAQQHSRTHSTRAAFSHRQTPTALGAPPPLPAPESQS